MKIESSNAPASENQVEIIEQRIGYPLPEEYRRFLLESNGGYPIPDGFIFHRRIAPGITERCKGMVHNFLGLHNLPHDNLENYLETYRGRIPDNLIPIAHDPGGNLICLSISGRDIGKVYYWDHDEEVEEGETPDYRNVYDIANTFASFLQSLQDFDE